MQHDVSVGDFIPVPDQAQYNPQKNSGAGLKLQRIIFNPC